MDEQRRRAEFVGSGELAVESVFQSILDRVGPTKFLGYDEMSAKSEIVALWPGQGSVQRRGSEPGSGGCHLPRNPFYGEQAVRSATPVPPPDRKARSK